MSIIRRFKIWWVGIRLSTIQILVLDCDGVMTDGTVPERQFNVKDGLGIKALLKAGIKVIVVSGAKEENIVKRLDELGVTETYLNFENKNYAMFDIAYHNKVTIDKIAYIGDDVNDLAVIGHVGLFISPSDAVKSVKRNSDYVTKAKGGQGCIREICDLILERKRFKNL